jgi:hypothetical protein
MVTTVDSLLSTGQDAIAQLFDWSVATTLFVN